MTVGTVGDFPYVTKLQRSPVEDGDLLKGTVIRNHLKNQKSPTEPSLRPSSIEKTGGGDSGINRNI